MQGESASNTGVRVGNDASYAQGGTTYDAVEIISHPNYNSNTMNNDIALTIISKNEPAIGQIVTMKAFFDKRPQYSFTVENN